MAQQHHQDKAAQAADELIARLKISDWFHTFGKDELDEVWVTEAFHPVPVMDTLLALLTIDEDDLAGDDDENDDED